MRRGVFIRLVFSPPRWNINYLKKERKQQKMWIHVLPPTPMFSCQYIGCIIGIITWQLPFEVINFTIFIILCCVPLKVIIRIE